MTDSLPSGSREEQAAACAHEESLEAALREAEEEQAAASHKWRNYWHHWENRVAAATLVFVVIYTVIQGWQLMVLRDQESHQLRAYLSIVGLAVDCCAGISFEGPGYQEDKRQLIFKMKNSGQTPASSVELSVGLFEYPHQTLFPPSTINYGVTANTGAAISGQTQKTSTYMVQGEEKTFYSGLDAVIGLRAINGYNNLAIYGTIRYIDTFNAPHAIDFCKIFAVLSDNSRFYADCPEHNKQRY